jgi:dTDP-4-amino-4,6-dideoxygalactose transaminase
MYIDLRLFTPYNEFLAFMAKFEQNIYVTQPSLPPLDEFIASLEDIWESKWLTNNGKFHEKFEAALCDHLGINYISLFANGTLALIAALQCLRITGEVITTPFSFVATTHALWWNNIKPVFVDIESEYCNLDPSKIEAAITPQTTAIIPVHVYGNPCDLDKLQDIADIYGLRLIYDAAHCFGVQKNGVSVLNYGDLSIISFHATKTFNTIEGGAIVCHDEKTKKRIDFLKNFGFADEVTVIAPGINAKMNELQAAYGLLQLNHIDSNIKKRNFISQLYRKNLSGIKGLRFLETIPGIKHNDSYFPVFIDEDFPISRDELYSKLKLKGIFTRRYFYPLISNLPAYRTLSSAKPENLAIANEVANKVLCLPIYPDLEQDQVERICNIIVNS